MRISDWSSDVCSSDLQAIELRCTLGDADEYALASIGAFYEGKFDRAGPDTLATIQRLTAAGRCISLRRETLMHVIEAYAENPTVHAVSSQLGYVYFRSEEHTSELQSLMRISY